MQMDLREPELPRLHRAAHSKRRRRSGVIADYRWLKLGIVGVLGCQPSFVYQLLRYYSWDGVKKHGSGRIGALREDGWIVAWLDHDVAAALLSTSRQRIGQYLRLLYQVGCVVPLRIEGNRRAYVLGSERLAPKYFADTMLQRADRFVRDLRRTTDRAGIVRRSRAVLKRQLMAWGEADRVRWSRIVPGCDAPPDAPHRREVRDLRATADLCDLAPCDYSTHRRRCAR